MNDDLLEAGEVRRDWNQPGYDAQPHTREQVLRIALQRIAGNRDMSAQGMRDLASLALSVGVST